MAGAQLTWCFRGFALIEVIVLVTEDVVMDIVLLGRLGSQNEGLNESSHGPAASRELSSHL